MTDAVMFDIDDTLINSRTGMRIERVYKLYKHLKGLGYKIIIVTARPGFAENRKWTREELLKNGITYDRLIFAKAEYKGLYKRMSGYNFVISVGDQATDLTDSQYCIKIST